MSFLGRRMEGGEGIGYKLRHESKAARHLPKTSCTKAPLDELCLSLHPDV